MKGNSAFLKYLILAITIGWSSFQFYTAGFGLFVGLPQRAITLCFILLLAFLYSPNAKNKSNSILQIAKKVILSGAILIVSGHIIFDYRNIAIRSGMATTTDIVLGFICILLVFEATRRTVGKSLVIVGGAFILYASAGPYMPGVLAHKGYSLTRIVEHMYLTTDGIFGVPAAVMTTYIYSFLYA